MQIIQHRRNTISELKATSVDLGVEIDIRSYGKDIILHHDPFEIGENFEQWLRYFHHKTLILNVKEEGLEKRVLELMKLYSINDFFFLDQSFPFLIQTAKTGERRCAVRISEFESFDTALVLAGKVDWIWIDCFTHCPLTYTVSVKLKAAGFKLCVVSPELQGFEAKSYIPELQRFFSNEDIVVDAVCTKEPQLWR
jgi:hypothetical protein